MTYDSLLARLGLLGMLFIVGFVLMGYEMLGSRYLNPYFGGGITTWACLISVVLLAMMIGYFSGGYVADRYPGTLPLAFITMTTGTMLIGLSYSVPYFMELTLDTLGDGFWGVLCGAVIITLVPVGLLSACSPFVVRLLLTELKSGGRITGTVYAISTFGNVIGTLATTFWLIPSLGTRSITKIFGVVLISLALVLLFQNPSVKRFARRGITVILAGLFVGAFALFGAAKANIVKLTAHYPEGPLWVDGKLLIAEMGTNTVSQWADGKHTVFWKQTGCGPTSIARYKSTLLAVNCHLGRKIAILDLSGKLVDTIAQNAGGKAFRRPNDVNDDGAGGVFFSDPGHFTLGLKNRGEVYHLAPDGTVSLVAENLRYPNGVAYLPASRTLYVSEHLGGQVLAFTLDESFHVVSKRVFLSRQEIFGREPAPYPLTGPDGIRRDADGTLYVALYGAGEILILPPTAGDPDKTHSQKVIHRVRVPMQFVTSFALREDRIGIVGAYDNRQPPYLGAVLILDKELLTHSKAVGF